MKNIFKLSKPAQGKWLAILCACILSITGTISANAAVSNPEVPAAVCTHPNVQITISDEPEYTHDAGSYCYALVQYKRYYCKDCGSNWVSKDNQHTTTHTWSTVSRTQTPQFSHLADSHCYTTIENVTSKCSTCGVTKTERINRGTSSHSWKEDSRTSDKVYSHAVDSYCYKTIDTVKKVCSKCGTTKNETLEKASYSHSWCEELDHYDGTYSYLKTKCQICFAVKSTKIVEGYVEVGLHHIEKEEKQ